MLDILVVIVKLTYEASRSRPESNRCFQGCNLTQYHYVTRPTNQNQNKIKYQAHISYIIITHIYTPYKHNYNYNYFFLFFVERSGIRTHDENKPRWIYNPLS